MSYPGNPSLGDEVRQRILATFVQSLELAETGRTQEAALGCDFILELDPQFKPAQTLKDRLAAGDGQALDDLRAQVSGGGAPAPEASTGGGAGDLLDLESLDLPDLGDSGSDAGGPADATDPRAAFAAELDRLLAARELQAVLDRAGEQRDLVMADPDLRQTVQTAQSRLEAQPYVESFLKEAGAALRTGDGERVDVALDKARSLDASHPLIDELAAARRQADEPGAAAVEQAPDEVSDRAPGQAAPELGAEDDDFDLGFDDDEEDDDGGQVDLSVSAEDEDLFAGFEIPPDLPDEKAAAPAAPQAPAEPAPEAPVGGDEVLADAGPAQDGGGAGALDEMQLGGGGGGGGGDDRIAQLLGEGQEAADRGDYQTAIDAWSRIFLIDVDHDEAARRIEDARRHKAEREREVEEVFHDGLGALERGERDEARARFEKVLEVQPSHLAAREYLQQIESGGPVTGPGSAPGEAAEAAGELGSFDLSDLSAGEGGGPSEPLKQEILVPPAPGESPGDVASAADRSAEGGTVAPRRVAAGASSGRRMFLLIGGAVLLLVLVAAWYVLQNKETFFPNSTTDESTQAAPGSEAPSVIERARKLHDKGSTAMALGQLKRIRPDQAEYEAAQELIAEWEAPAEPTEAEESAPTISPEDLARRSALIGKAKEAFAQHEYLQALELFARARDIAPLEGDDEASFRRSAQELEPLKREIELFHQGEYEMIMSELWRLLEQDPANRDARRLLVNSYYNRGVRELQRSDAGRAAAEFQEALSLAPDDAELQRHYLFAKTYEHRSKDLLYRIYVKYLPFR